MDATSRMMCGTAVAFLAVTAAQAKLSIIEQKGRNKQIVAQRLTGRWVLREDLSRELSADPHAKREGGAFVRLEFVRDPAVLDSIPAEFDRLLKGVPVYLAGKMTRTLGTQKRENPFVLAIYEGNGMVVYFRDREDFGTGETEPLGDAESLHVILVPGKRSQNDLLFVGGDFSDETFRAFRREEAAVAAADMPPGLADAIREGIALLEAKKYEAFVRRFASPEDLREIIQEGRLEELIRDMESGGSEIGVALEMFKAALGRTPDVSRDGTKAEFEDIHGHDDLEFRLIDGRWYVE